MIEGWPEKKKKFKNKNKLPVPPPPLQADDGRNNSNSSSNLYFPLRDNTTSININSGASASAAINNYNSSNNDHDRVHHQFLLRDYDHHHQGSSLVSPDLQPILEPQPPPPSFCNWLLVPPSDQPTADFWQVDNHFQEQKLGSDIVGINSVCGDGTACSSSASVDLCNWLHLDNDDPSSSSFLDLDEFFNFEGQHDQFPLLDFSNFGNDDEGTSINLHRHNDHVALENQLNVDHNDNSSSGFDNTLIEPVPAPPAAVAADCSDLLPPPFVLLREITHSNGNQVRHLEIYGQIGIISHAIMYKIGPDNSPGNLDHQLFNFSGESWSNVKNFLIQYCEDCKKEGYWMVQDPFLEFYQALCVGMFQPLLDSGIGSSGGVNMMMMTSNGGGSSSNPEQSTTSYQQQNVADRNGVRRSKISLSKQRERTGKLSLKDFSKYFDHKITEVAQIMDVCPTVVKKKCREAGLPRWPYRKIKGLKRKIKAKQDSLMNASSDAERSQNLLEIQMLEQQLKDIYTQLGQLQV